MKKTEFRRLLTSICGDIVAKKNITDDLEILILQPNSEYKYYKLITNGLTNYIPSTTKNFLKHEINFELILRINKKYFEEKKLLSIQNLLIELEKIVLNLLVTLANKAKYFVSSYDRDYFNDHTSFFSNYGGMILSFHHGYQYHFDEKERSYSRYLSLEKPNIYFLPVYLLTREEFNYLLYFGEREFLIQNCGKLARLNTLNHTRTSVLDKRFDDFFDMAEMVKLSFDKNIPYSYLDIYNKMLFFLVFCYENALLSEEFLHYYRDLLAELIDSNNFKGIAEFIDYSLKGKLTYSIFNEIGQIFVNRFYHTRYNEVISDSLKLTEKKDLLNWAIYLTVAENKLYQVIKLRLSLLLQDLLLEQAKKRD